MPRRRTAPANDGTSPVLGASSAVAYENLLRYEALERSSRRLELLHEIDRSILDARSPKRSPRSALRALRD